MTPASARLGLSRPLKRDDTVDIEGPDALKEAVKDVLSVPDVLEACGIEVDHEARRRRSIPCPLHGGKKPSGFSWSPDGRGWACWTDECGRGDVIAFVAKHKGWKFPRVVEALAQLVRASGTELRLGDATTRAAQRATREAKAAAPTASRKQVTAIEDRLIQLAKRGGAQVFVRHPWLSWWPTGHTRRELGEAYLMKRGLGRLIAGLGYLDLVYAEDGSPTVPLFGLERCQRSVFGNPPINLVTRLIRPNDPARKVLNMPGYPATGSFGRSHALEGDDHFRTLFLVEGVFDYLSALQLYRGNPSVLVLGAPGAAMLPTIIERLGDDPDPRVRTRFRTLGVTLVEHLDDAGRAAARRVRAAAAARGMTVETFDLMGANDLNELICRPVVP